MKDLDFDELDQAVSSVLSNANTTNEKPVAPATPVTVPTASITPTESAAPAPEAPAPVAPTPAPAAVSPAVKRRGQFLDMVHPSADMTGRGPVAAPTARKKIGPVSNNVAPDAASEPTQAPTPAVAELLVPEASIDAPAETTPSVPESAPTKDLAWPDPLDLTSPVPATTETPAAVDTPTPTPEPVAETPAEPDAEAEPVSTTPFVTDAKVDKRPLGAFANEDTPATPDVADTTSQPPQIDEQKTPDVTPPELQPDVVSVEAAANREFTPEEPISAPEPDPTPADKPANSGLSQSIPQQYHTPNDAPDQTPHPVFDTKEYHQPLLPAPHKKKAKSWLVVLIILLLLVAGSALGYFAFMAGL